MKVKYNSMLQVKSLMRLSGPVDYQEARQVALARNPNATVVSVTAVF